MLISSRGAAAAAQLACHQKHNKGNNNTATATTVARTTTATTAATTLHTTTTRGTNITMQTTCLKIIFLNSERLSFGNFGNQQHAHTHRQSHTQTYTVARTDITPSTLRAKVAPTLIR